MGYLLRKALKAAAAALLFGFCITSASAQVDAKRGEYIAKAGGCLGCHTEDRQDAAPYAGGRALKTPFGTFYGPNITPHAQAGIGRWTESDFVRAMRHGRRPDGANYYPAFPYAAFTKITDDDLRDLWAYLQSLRPSGRGNRKHELRFPYGWRFLVIVWNWLYFAPGPFMATPGVSDAINRGAYLVLALGHCGECHTPRNFLGAPRSDRFLAGAKGMPNLTPTGLKHWSDEELAELFRSGETPADGPVSSEMLEVVRNTTSQLTPADLKAMIAYLRSLAPLPEQPRQIR